MAVASVGCPKSSDPSTSPSTRNALDSGASAAHGPPKPDTVVTSRWWRTPDGAFHLIGPARPRDYVPALEPADWTPDWKHMAFSHKGTVTIWWNIEHNCGLEPDPRVKVSENRIALSAGLTGQPRSNCLKHVTCFKTVISGVPFGSYELVNPPYYKAHLVVSEDEEVKAAQNQ